MLYSQYHYGELQKPLLFQLLQEKPKQLHSLLLSIELQLFSYFCHFYIRLSRNFVIITNIKSILLLYF